MFASQKTLDAILERNKANVLSELASLVGETVQWFFLNEELDDENRLVQGVCGVPAVLADIQAMPNDVMRVELFFKTEVEGFYLNQHFLDAIYLGLVEDKEYAFCAYSQRAAIKEILGGFSDTDPNKVH